jgi:hypothetical protein
MVEGDHDHKRWVGAQAPAGKDTDSPAASIAGISVSMVAVGCGRICPDVANVLIPIAFGAFEDAHQLAA